jgi:hypothetical protein
MSASPQPLPTKRAASWLRFYAAGLLALPGAVVVVVSLFLPWLTITLSVCAFSACTSGRSQTFSFLEIMAAHGLISLIGGPFTALLPLVGGYVQLGLWCLATTVCGLIFAGIRLSARRPSGFASAVRRPRRSWLLVALSLVLLVLVVMTIVQLFVTFGLQSAVHVAVLKLTGGSVLQPGPLLLVLALIALGSAGVLGLRDGWTGWP